MHTDTVISVQNVSKKFKLYSSAKDRLWEAMHPLRKPYHQEFWALRNVSFEVHRGEIVGILGRNGSGKSTLLQIICSVMQATAGEVLVNGRISALLELGAGFNPEFTGRDNVIFNGAVLGFTYEEMLKRIPDIEAFADIGEFFDQPVKTYSSGMFVRVAFAAAIHVDPEILIVDEALSVGDSKFQHRCFQRIREFMEQGKTIVVVSHSTDMLLRVCQRGIVVDAGTLGYVGSIADAVNFYQDLLFGVIRRIDAKADPNLSSVMTNEGKHQMVSAMELCSDNQDKVSCKPGYNQHETRLGNGGVKVIDFDLIVDGKMNPSELPTHKEIQLIVKLRFDESLAGVSTGFAIVSIDGTYVFGTNLAMLGESLLSAEAGTCVASKFFWTSHIAGGEYFLNLGCTRLANGEDSYLDVRRSVAKITCSETFGISGLVDLGVTHEAIEQQTREQRSWK